VIDDVGDRAGAHTDGDREPSDHCSREGKALRREGDPAAVAGDDQGTDPASSTAPITLSAVPARGCP
jgi:hypothetical protein